MVAGSEHTPAHSFLYSSYPRAEQLKVKWSAPELRLVPLGGKCTFPECRNSACDLCQKCGMSIAAEEAGKLPGLHIQQNSQPVSRVTCMCSNIFFVETDSSSIDVWRRRRIWTFLLGLSQSQTKEMGILGFVIVSRETHITPLSILMSITFYSLGLKSSFVWSELYCHSQNLQKLIVNVFTSGIS